MLRKVFLKGDTVLGICIFSEGESTEGMVEGSNSFVFVEDDSVIIDRGYEHSVDLNGVSTFIYKPFIDLGPVRSVKMKQARLALLAGGHLAAVKSAIATMAEEAQIEWEFSETVERDSQLVKDIATLLTLTNEQINELFLIASTL